MLVNDGPIYAVTSGEKAVVLVANLYWAIDDGYCTLCTAWLAISPVASSLTSGRWGCCERSGSAHKSQDGRRSKS